MSGSLTPPPFRQSLPRTFCALVGLGVVAAAMVTGAARRWRVGTAYWGRVFSVAKFKVATRAPLSLNDINTLIDVAVGLHEVAADRIKDRRWMIQLLVPLAGSVLVGLLAFAAVYLKTKS